MEPINITIPDVFLHEIQIKVRSTDLNYGNHLGNDKLLCYLQECRVDFLRNHGFENELCLEGDVGLILSDSALQYKSEGFLNHEINVKMGVLDISLVSFQLVYQLHNLSTGKILALGRTGVVCFDYKRRKVNRIPDSLQKVLTT